VRLEPADLDARELAERSRLVPRRHVVQLTNGAWYELREVLELGGFVVGYQCDALEGDESVSCELSHIETFMEAWELARTLERSAENTRRARARERWRDDWQRPVGVGSVFEWLSAGDRRATEPAWKASRRARQIRRAT
jgi:hypothetical protein